MMIHEQNIRETKTSVCRVYYSVKECKVWMSQIWKTYMVMVWYVKRQKKR